MPWAPVLPDKVARYLGLKAPQGTDGNVPQEQTDRQADSSAFVALAKQIPTSLLAPKTMLT